MTHHRDAAVQHSRAAPRRLAHLLGLAGELRRGFGRARRGSRLRSRTRARSSPSPCSGPRRGPAERRVVRCAHGGAAVSAIGLAACSHGSVAGLLVPPARSDVRGAGRGWRAVAPVAAGFSCFGLVLLSERVVVVEPEHVFTVLETQIACSSSPRSPSGTGVHAPHRGASTDEDEQRRDTVLEQRWFSRGSTPLAQWHVNVPRVHGEIALGAGQPRDPDPSPGFG